MLTIILVIISRNIVRRGSVVVEALRYNPKGRGFQIRWKNLILSIFLILLAALGSGIYSACNINEYQREKYKIFLGIRGRPLHDADNLTAVYEPIV
jgi:hypothetical protein